MKKTRIVITAVLFLLMISNGFAGQWRRGIYITQNTVENGRNFSALIKQAKRNGVNTLIVDLQRVTPTYKKNIRFVRENGLLHIARIVVFPKGGTDAQVLSQSYWEKKYQLVDAAIKLGAQEIQLDYIRYNGKQRPSDQNARNIYRVIKWFKTKLKARNIPLQIDVFGITGYVDAVYIGQNLRLFAPSVDAICPMVYPSHYDPYIQHARTPYATVLGTLLSINDQFSGKIPFKVYPFIELYNYRYPLSQLGKLRYIYQQIKAIQDDHANGWFAWSPNNKYQNLFQVMQQQKLK